MKSNKELMTEINNSLSLALYRNTKERRVLILLTRWGGTFIFYSNKLQIWSISRKMISPRKEEILRVAQQLFSYFGFAKTTVDEIAKAARMGKASLYYYFRSKNEIFETVLECENQILEQKITQAVDKEHHPLKKIKAFALARIQSLKELTNISRVIQGEISKHEENICKFKDKILAQELATVKRILKEGREKKIFRIKNLEQTALVIISALKGLEHSLEEKITASELEQHLDKLLEVIFLGIKY